MLVVTFPVEPFWRRGFESKFSRVSLLKVSDAIWNVKESMLCKVTCYMLCGPVEKMPFEKGSPVCSQTEKKTGYLSNGTEMSFINQRVQHSPPICISPFTAGWGTSHCLERSRTTTAQILPASMKSTRNLMVC